MSIPSPYTELGELVSEIVAAYARSHAIETVAVPVLVQSVYKALAELSRGPIEPKALAPQPAMPIKKSLFPDFIICLGGVDELVDGRGGA